VVIASAFGGFWCARLLLDTKPAQVVFVWLSVVLLVGIIGLYLARPDLWGSLESLIDTNPHPVADRMMLLFFAPLTLILRGRKAAIIGSIAILLLAYLVFYLSNLRSAMLIPLVLGVIAVLLGSIRMRYFLAVLIPVAVVLALFFHQLPSEKIGREYEPAYYRAENYPFSWHIAKKHPWLGIGLRAPREQFLEDYEVKYPYVTKEKFAESVRAIVSSENIFLTFMAEVGFPFTILYVISVGYLLVRLVRRVTAHDRTSIIPPVALLMSVAAGLVHFQVLDGLLHPQISWFFHILLGLIPGGDGGGSSVATMHGAQIHPLGKD
jgi:O-antigen ligase